MSEGVKPDPLDELLAADPVDVDRLPSASLARIRARNEAVMTTSSRRRPWAPRTIGLGVGVAAVAAIALVVAFGGRGGIAPGVSPGISTGTGSAACVEPYSPTALANRSFAFDGTVSAIDGERVTFNVGAAYRGVSGATVTLDAPGMTGTAITSAGGPNLTIGERYLVAGDDHFVWSCGYTQPYDAAVAADWAAALAG
jgi:hypothetical protein